MKTGTSIGMMMAMFNLCAAAVNISGAMDGRGIPLIALSTSLFAAGVCIGMVLVN